jgi:probable phosphoglycerate mutase
MKRVLLIRHAESQHNAQGDCLSGVADTPITDLGRAQATALKHVLARFSVDTVYSSPLGRAMETARLAVPEFADSIQTVQCLLEFDYGDYDGIPSNNLNETDSVIRQWNQAPGSLCFPNGDCISDHAERAFNGLIDLVAHAPGEVVACFSHKTTIRLVVAKALDIPLDYFRRIPCANASISVCRYQQHAILVESLNLILADIFLEEIGK